MPDRRFRCEEEYFKLCTSPYLTLPLSYLEPHSLSLSPSSLSLFLNTTLPHLPLSLLQVITVCFPTLSHPFQPTCVHCRPPTNKTKQTKPQHGVNNSLYSLTFNSRLLLGAGLAPYLLGILSSTPESNLPCRRYPYPTLQPLVGRPCWQASIGNRKGESERGGFCRGGFL